jgi:hypothetical protein
MKHLYSIVLFSLLLSTSQLSALILLDDVMSRKEQQQTGLDKLTHTEKRALEQWLNKNMLLKTEKEKTYEKQSLYVSEVINLGQQLRLSDNSLFEVAPEDWDRASSWIIAANVVVTRSNDTYYPWQITNPISGLNVKARLLEKPLAPMQQP